MDEDEPVNSTSSCRRKVNGKHKRRSHIYADAMESNCDEITSGTEKGSPLPPPLRGRNAMHSSHVSMQPKQEGISAGREKRLIQGKEVRGKSSKVKGV